MFNRAVCNKSFTYEYNLPLHVKFHDGIIVPCTLRTKVFS